MASSCGTESCHQASGNLLRHGHRVGRRRPPLRHGAQGNRRLAEAHQRAADRQRLLGRLPPSRRPGLLDGRRATTHRTTAPSAFPPPLSQGSRWMPSASSSRTATWDPSAGISAGIDLALALIEDDFGNARSPAGSRSNWLCTSGAGRQVAVSRARGTGWAGRPPLRRADRMDARPPRRGS